MFSWDSSSVGINDIIIVCDILDTQNEGEFSRNQAVFLFQVDPRCVWPPSCSVYSSVPLSDRPAVPHQPAVQTQPWHAAAQVTLTHSSHNTHLFFSAVLWASLFIQALSAGWRDAVHSVPHTQLARRLLASLTQIQLQLPAGSGPGPQRAGTHTHTCPTHTSFSAQLQSSILTWLCGKHYCTKAEKKTVVMKFIIKCNNI